MTNPTTQRVPLPSPLDTFEVDVPKNEYYDFELPEGSTYPLAGVTYPVDYGHIQGYTTEDGHELDLFVGEHVSDGKMGYIVVDRGESMPNEHKFYLRLSDDEVDGILTELKPVLVQHGKIEDLAALLESIKKYKDGHE